MKRRLSSSASSTLVRSGSGGSALAIPARMLTAAATTITNTKPSPSNGVRRREMLSGVTIAAF